MREARRALLSVACAMTRASACGSSWLSVESRRVALATIATPSRADAPRRRPVAAVRHAIAAEAPATHWAGRQKARAALASATRLMSESDRASFAAYDVEFVVEISRCRAPLHRSTTEALRPAADVELYSSTALQSALHLYSSTALYTLHPLHPPSDRHHTHRQGFFKKGESVVLAVAHPWASASSYLSSQSYADSRCVVGTVRARGAACA